MLVVTTNANIDVENTITYNRDWYTGKIESTVEWEGRNWKTKSYTDISGVYYITDGITTNVKRTTNNYYEKLGNNEYMMIPKKSSTTFNLPGGATVGGYTLSWYGNSTKPVHTEDIAAIVVDSTVRESYEQTIRQQWLYGRSQAGKRVYGFNTGLGDISVNESTTIVDNTLTDEEIMTELSGAIQGSQEDALAYAENKTKAPKSNLSAWQKFVNTVGGAFDAYNASSGTTAGLSITVSNAGIVGGVVSMGSNSSQSGVSDLMFEGIKSALETIKSAAQNNYRDYEMPTYSSRPSSSFFNYNEGQSGVVAPVKNNGYIAPYNPPTSPLDYGGGKTIHSFHSAPGGYY